MRFVVMGVMVITTLFMTTLVLAKPSAGKVQNFLQFDVTAQNQRFEKNINSRLRLQVVRVPHATIKNFGWIVEVVDRSKGKRARNLLYHSDIWRGPYPVQIFSQDNGTGLFPDRRILPVWGYPYEVEIELVNCKTEGEDGKEEFASGQIQVIWRRTQALDPFAGLPWAKKDKRNLNRFPR